MPGLRLKGMRILVAEDEIMVSLLIEDVLAEQHCTILGPFEHLHTALDAARTAEFDAAVLDVNLAGAKIYPVAEVLTQRNIPFLFISGYGARAIPKNRPTWRVCGKPFKPETLVAMLTEQITAMAPCGK